MCPHRHTEIKHHDDVTFHEYFSLAFLEYQERILLVERLNRFFTQAFKLLHAAIVGETYRQYVDWHHLLLHLQKVKKYNLLPF